MQRSFFVLRKTRTRVELTKHHRSYFGIVPRVSNSNETEHSGRIHKRGTKLGRTALVQAALIAAKYSSRLLR